MFKSLMRDRALSSSLAIILGSSGTIWLGSAMVAPQMAQAYTAKLDLTLTLQYEETYESLVSRGEAVARAIAQRSFDQDILVTDVEVMLLVDSEGKISPLLELKVSRQSWKRNPDPQRWISYFPETKTLLGFDQPNSEETKK